MPTIARRRPTFPLPLAPLRVAGLQAWLKADALGLADGVAVSSWADSSGKGANAVQATGANQPLCKTNILNGLPVVRFDGTNDYLTIPDSAALDLDSGEGNTVFVVAKSTVTGGGFVSKRDGANNGWGLIHSGTSVTWTVDVTTATNINGTTAIGSTWEILTGSRSAAGSNTVRVGGISEGTPASRTGDASNAIDVHIGSRYTAGPTSFLNGDIAEVLIFDTGLGNGDLNSVGNYLAAKYALAWTNA